MGGGGGDGAGKWPNGQMDNCLIMKIPFVTPRIRVQPKRQRTGGGVGQAVGSGGRGGYGTGAQLIFTSNWSTICCGTLIKLSNIHTQSGREEEGQHMCIESSAH